MATNFPAGLDDFRSPISQESLSTKPHNAYHDDEFDAIEALERKVGVTGSRLAGTLTESVEASINPGHKHTAVAVHEATKENPDPHSKAGYVIMVGGRKICVQSTAPIDPGDGDLWLDISTLV